MAIPFFGGLGGGAGLAGGIKLGLIIFCFILFFIGMVFLLVIMSKERLKIAILGVKGKIISGVVYKKNNQRFVKIRGNLLPIPYPADECIIPISKLTNLAVMRQIGDDLVPYNVRDMNMEIGDNRLMRQQHSITLREVMDKYDSKTWFDKAGAYFALAMFGVLMILIMTVGHKTICG